MPDSTSTKPLSELATLRTERIVGAKDGSKPYVGLEHIASGEPFLLGTARAESSISTNSAFYRGDVLFGKLRPNLRKSLHAQFDGYCSTDILVLQPNAGFDPGFVARVFQREEVFNEAVRMAEGTKMPRTSWARLRQYEVFVPEADHECTTIAAILDAADEAIAKTEALIAKLRAIEQGLLYDLLTRGLDDNGELRDPEKHPEQFKETPLGRIPKAWAEEPLGEICAKHGGSIQTGPFGSQLHAEDYVEDGTPIVTVEHLGDGIILHENLPRVSPKDRSRLSRYNLQEGDLVFSRVGAIDRCARVGVAEDGWLFSGRCLRVRPGEGGMNSFYLAYQLNGFRCRRWILAHAVGSTMQCLNTTILGRLPVFEPSVEEQELIGRVLLEHDTLLREEVRCLSKLKAIKKGLMQDLLTGRVRVPADMIATTATG